MIIIMTTTVMMILCVYVMDGTGCDSVWLRVTYLTCCVELLRKHWRKTEKEKRMLAGMQFDGTLVWNKDIFSLPSSGGDEILKGIFTCMYSQVVGIGVRERERGRARWTNIPSLPHTGVNSWINRLGRKCIPVSANARSFLPLTTIQAEGVS